MQVLVIDDESITRRVVAHTLKALSFCTGLPEKSAVADIGCGPGMQTLALANALDGHITAVDFYQAFLDDLDKRAKAAHLSEKITTLNGNMNVLPFSEAQFDLIWSEGAAYIMGIEKALTTWKPFLKPGGYIAFTEVAWLQPDPPAAIFDFWHSEYPAITDIQGNLDMIKKCGYEVAAHFVLPDAAWWEDYYTPLEAKLPALDAKYTGNEVAQEILNGTRHEIAMRRQYPQAYSYVFFVCRS